MLEEVEVEREIAEGRGRTDLETEEGRASGGRPAAMAESVRSPGSEVLSLGGWGWGGMELEMIGEVEE